MSDIHVSDFASFITAVTTSGADVIIDADLDANTWQPVVTNWLCNSVNGQNHAIRNIQHTISGGYDLFRLTNTNGCTISNTKFLNLVLTPGSPWGSDFIYGAAGTNYIKNCEFQGLIKTQRLLEGKIDLISQCTFSCEIGSYGTLLDLNGISLSVGHQATVVDECYFDCHSGGDSNYYTATIINFSSPTFSVVSNCYFKGYAKSSNANEISINGVLHNCVVNIDYTADENITALKIGNPAISLSGVTLYNSTKIDSQLTVTAQQSLVGLSDSELKYPGGLTAIPATGFPLIV